MGAISDQLNAPREFSIGGAVVKVRRMSFGELYEIMVDSMKQLGIEGVGIDLEKKVEEQLSTGEIPKCAIPRILEKGLAVMPDVDDDDIIALTQLANVGELAICVGWITGLGDENPQDADAPHPVEQTEGQKKTDS